jgi:hypothetical protein
MKSSTRKTGWLGISLALALLLAVVPASAQCSYSCAGTGTQGGCTCWGTSYYCVPTTETTVTIYQWTIVIYTGEYGPFPGLLLEPYDITYYDYPGTCAYSIDAPSLTWPCTLSPMQSCTLGGSEICCPDNDGYLYSCQGGSYGAVCAPVGPLIAGGGGDGSSSCNTGDVDDNGDICGSYDDVGAVNASFPVPYPNSGSDYYTNYQDGQVCSDNYQCASNYCLSNICAEQDELCGNSQPAYPNSGSGEYPNYSTGMECEGGNSCCGGECDTGNNECNLYYGDGNPDGGGTCYSEASYEACVNSEAVRKRNPVAVPTATVNLPAILKSTTAYSQFRQLWEAGQLTRAQKGQGMSYFNNLSKNNLIALRAARRKPKPASKK